MDLKLNIQKRCLNANTEVINEEYTLAFGHIFRGIPTYKTTHSELKAKRDAGQLVAGAFYRITDYEATTTQANTQSVGHPFDIIVQALEERTLSEDAQAIQREGDTYFADSNLAAWKLRYTLDNDTTRFGWAKKEVAERAQSWTASWGVLESKLNSDASSNYTTAVVGGRTKYLYAPAERGTYLDNKTFYRNILVDSITSTDGFIFEADNAPYEEGDDYWNWDDVTEIRVKTADGNLVTTLYHEYDNAFYDENDDMSGYYIYFSPDYAEVDGVYRFTPESGVEDWWEYVYGGEIATYEKEYYTGSVDALYYAFDTILPKSNKEVTEVYSTETKQVYMAEGTLDTVVYQSYIAPVEGGKGVIYRMVDEFGNDAPFDFKNIQHKQNDAWCYTFNLNGEDYSLNKDCQRNRISHLYGKQIAKVIFDVLGTNYSLKENTLDVSVSGTFYCAANVCDGNIWRKSEQLNLALDYFGNFTFNSGKNAVRVLGHNRFYGVTYSLNIVGNQRDCIFHLAGNGNSGLVRVSISNVQCISNTYDFRNAVDSSRTITIEGGAIRYTRLKILDGTFVNNMVLAHSDIVVSKGVTLSSGNSSSTNYAISNLYLDGMGWTTAEDITIVDTFPTNASYSLRVAKNSSGVIKQWCEADLIDAIATNANKILEYHPENTNN